MYNQYNNVNEEKLLASGWLKMSAFSSNMSAKLKHEYKLQTACKCYQNFVWLGLAVCY